MNTASCSPVSQDTPNGILEQLRKMKAENVIFKETNRDLKWQFYQDSKLIADIEKRAKYIKETYANVNARQKELTEEVNEIQETIQSCSKIIGNLFVPKKITKRDKEAKSTLLSKKEALIQEQKDMKTMLLVTQNEIQSKTEYISKMSALVEKLDLNKEELQNDYLRRENEKLEAKFIEMEAYYAKKKELEKSQAYLVKDSVSRKLDEEVSVTDFSITNKNTSFDTPISVVRKSGFRHERFLKKPYEPVRRHKFFNFETMSVVDSVHDK